MDIDDTNIEILRHLKDGRKSYKLIAEDLSLTENTIRSRVNKLIEEGILKFSGTVQIDALPGHNLLYLGVKLKTMELAEKSRRIQQIKRSGVGGNSYRPIRHYPSGSAWP